MEEKGEAAGLAFLGLGPGRPVGGGGCNADEKVRSWSRRKDGN
jgi:hypothetical protein